MKSLTLVALTVALMPFAAQAGGGKAVIEKNPVVEAPCYDGGFEFGVFGTGFFPENHYEDSFGGGVSLGYFYNENLGFDLGAAWYGTDSEVHNYTLDAVYRLPFNCIAPYILAGGGVHTNGETEGLFRFGGGVDFRVFNGSSIFADGIYNLLGGDVDNYAIARLGLRFSF
ncbi:MAG: hypothetical protein JNK37_13380 [Verrucomicrobiales bacterium]|nr:hypothetical protein [Verrucomicrobiales bacterium]